MKVIRHKDKKICNNCKHFKKRSSNLARFPDSRAKGFYCNLWWNETSKDSTCDNWEAK